MIKTRKVSKSEALNYIQRAEECKAATQFSLDQGNWNSCLTTAIQCAISSADAVCVYQLGERSASDNHADAGRLLIQIDPNNEEIKMAVKHLSHLINLKTDAQYGEKLFSKNEAEQAAKHAERLLSYAKSVIKA